MKTIKKWGLALAFAVSLGVFSSCETPYGITTTVHYTSPAWAPPYHPGARYYYFPDIEVYYDLSDHHFVYLQNGNWLFSPVFPSIYVGFDLYTAFIITLNVQVYQPWLHHHYYVAHYPRYFYHNTYQQDFGRIRGYNENERKPLFWGDGERDRVKDLRKTEAPVRQFEPPKAPQKTNYYGKPVGQPVKVKPQMKIKPKQGKPVKVG